MKSLILLAFISLNGIALCAQDQGQISKIGRQLADYYNYYPKEKVFVATDKSQYKPGETIWFRAFVSASDNQPIRENNRELFVKLYDKNGKPLIQDIFRITQGAAPGDLAIPGDLQAGEYFLVAYTQTFASPERISCTPLRIDPLYNNQFVAETVLKDSISVAGQKNELLVTLHEISGDIRKNTTFRYQFMNGDEILEKGKVKTDEKGRVQIPLTMPEKTNGDPFICEMSDSRSGWYRKVWLPSNLDPLVVRIYPEGGNLVNGVQGKIGFTAFNKWGIPVDVEGKVTNQNGKEIAQVKTFTKGMGLITLNDDKKEKYKLVVTGKTGQSQSFNFPASMEAGLALSVIKADTAFIAANFIFPDKQKHRVLIVVSRAGDLYWAANVEINGSSRIKIPTKTLPQGINLLSVFSNEGNLLAERILFTDRNQKLKIDVQPEKKMLQPNQSMKVDVRLTDENGKPVSGNIAISVSDKFRNKTAPPEIEKCTLVGSELETPFSLISGEFKGKISNTPLLDVFLLANQIKSFDWNKILNFKPGSSPDLRTINNEIRGVVTDKNNNRINKAKVSLVNNRNIQLFTTTTNEEGLFSFSGINTSSADDYLVKATDPEGKRKLNVVYGKNLEGQISTFIRNAALMLELSGEGKFTDVKYVKENPSLFEKELKSNPGNANKVDNQRRMLESGASIMDVIKSLKPYRIMNNQIVFSGSENSFVAQGGALLIVDGQQMGTDISIIQSISPLEIDHINVSTSAVDIQQYTGLNSVGIVEIYLKNGKSKETAAKPEKKNVYDGMFRVPNAFRAEADGNNNTTLLWIPVQQVDNSGTFEFTVAAGAVISDFVIEVQGISDKVRMGSGEARFSVVK